MTLAAFDPRNITQYETAPYLLHFQWGDGKVYRYALVEEIQPSHIDHRSKQKRNEHGLTQKQIWEKHYEHRT